MFGKTVPFFIVSVVQTLLLFLAGRMLFGMSWGTEPWLLIPVIFATSMSATTLGLMVATVVKTDSQVSAYATSVMIVMAGISGCFLPRDWLPDMMKTISLGTPHAWALMAYREILTTEHPRLGEVFQYCSVLAGFSAVYFLFGAWRFRPPRLGRGSGFTAKFAYRLGRNATFVASKPRVARLCRRLWVL